MNALEGLILLFQAAEALVEKELARALSRGAEGSAAQRNRRLAEVRAILADLRLKAAGTETTTGMAWEVVKEGYREGSKRADRDTPEGASTDLGGIHLGAAQVLHETLVDDLDSAILHVERHANRTLRKVAVREVLVGQLAGRPEEKTAAALEENLRSRGVRAFTDSLGREWKLSTYARMAANQASAEAATTATLNRLAENGIDLVKVSEHPHKNDVCSAYEGRIFSISGEHPTYPVLEEAPPYHPFCRHVLTAYVEALAA